MKRILAIIVVLTGLSSCIYHSQSWTDAYYNTMYGYFYKINSQYIKNEKNRKLLTIYEITKLKAKLPDGISTVSADSLKKMLAKIGHDFSKEHNMDDWHETVPWTAEGENSFKEAVLSGKFIKKIDKNLRDKFCDCLLLKLKTAYPDSLTIPLPDTLYSKIVDECLVKFPIGKK
jgi:hypothetical protein